jgi:hypothetical protein
MTGIQFEEKSALQHLTKNVAEYSHSLTEE